MRHVSVKPEMYFDWKMLQQLTAWLLRRAPHLAHPDLPHQLVLVSVHASELPHMGEGVLQAVCKLEGVHIAQPELDIGIHYQLGQPQNLSAKVEGVAEAGLLTLLGGQGLHRLQVEVVVQVQVVEVLAVDQQVQHVVALSADLRTSPKPVKHSLASLWIQGLRLLLINTKDASQQLQVREEDRKIRKGQQQ